MAKRVLFIDDELECWQNALAEELGIFGFQILGQENPSDVLKLIDSYKPDVVLLDILFPNGYLGKPTLEKIKKKHPDLPVMMITSTLDKSEYKAEDYALADYRYAKAALADGDYSDLAAQLDKLIERAKGNILSQEDETGMSSFGFIVGKTRAMREVAETVSKVAGQEHTVLVTGESGTGKELIARSIHMASKRREYKFTTIVCAALPKDLLESELFGHEKGAFTGAVAQRQGKFQIAGDGTIFLDEIGEMPLDTQVKLLRFLQDRNFERVGGNTTLTSNARIIAATNQEPKELIMEGRFREDLYYRLNVVYIQMPALRDRKEDIPLFFEHFVKKANKISKRILPILRDDLKALMTSYDWPGNIREFENLINRAVALADENILQKSNFPDLFHDYAGGLNMPFDISSIVDRVYQGELTWTVLSKEFGARGVMRKELLEHTVNQWLDRHQHHPSSEDLARLLSVSPGNMRRILSECGIKLRKIASDH